MPVLERNGIALNYVVAGEGPTILLVHGFASNIAMNWIGPGWIDALVGAGWQVVAFDHRGHGESDKPHDPEAYTPPEMVADAIAILDELEIERAVWMGYSMGARVGAFAAISHPNRVRALVLGGLGTGLVTGLDGSEGIAEGLLAPSIDDVTEPRPRMFRAFADKTKSDRLALAACIQTSRETLSEADVGAIAAPTLVAIGTRDDLAGSADGLAAIMPNATALDIPNRDHMLAVGDKAFKAGVLNFLNVLEGNRG